MQQKRKNSLLWFGVMLAGIAITIGIGMRVYDSHALAKETKSAAITKVAFILPAKSPNQEELVLPANVEAWHEATIYSRVDGYVKNWFVPMGTQVKEGQLLAVIDAPETDAQLRQAEADIKTAEANNNLAQITAERWKTLLKSDSVSKQDVDEKVGAALASAATLNSMIANRDHLKELVGFEKIVAPFDGLITARWLDIGEFISSTTSTTGQQLYHIVQQDKLRVYIKVPQNESVKITPQVIAEIHFTERPGEVYKATFFKSAESLDASTRTLLVEYLLENKDGKLFAGGYAEAHLKFAASRNELTLPVNSLIFRAAGLQVATLDSENKVHLKKITLGRDFGNTVEVAAGLEETERVVINPPDSLQDGQQVSILESKK